MTNLERVLPREALVAVATWEWFDCEMYPLVSLEVVVAVETLWTLIAPERPIILRAGLLWMAVELLHLSCVSTVEAWHHAMRHSSDHLQMAVWITYI